MTAWNSISDSGDYHRISEQEDLEELQTYSEAETVFQEYNDKNTACSYQDITVLGNTNWKSGRPSFLSSLVRCSLMSIQTTVISGVILGVFATTIWWLDLNLAQCCYSYTKRWSHMPAKYQKIRLTSHIVEAVILELWPISLVIPVFNWSLLHQLQLPLWSIIAAYTDTCYRLYLYIYNKYKTKGTNYFCNFIFLCIAMMINYKIARFISATKNHRINYRMLACKLGLQVLFGLLVTLVFDYWIVDVLKESSDFKKAILASSLPAIFFLPKIIISFVIARVKGVFSPGKAIMFTMCYHVGTTLISRLVQADNERFTFFVAISFVHGVLNVVDKLTLEIREKLVGLFCRVRGEGRRTRTPRMARLLADQTIVHVITETMVIMTSCAAVEILTYYYGKQQTGQRHNGNTLFQNFLIRVSIALLIELIFNIIAVKILTYHFNIPVIRVWTINWRWILLVLSTQVLFSMVAFSEYIDAVILHKSWLNSNNTNHCLGPFERL